MRCTPKVAQAVPWRPAKKEGESDSNIYQMEVERNPAAQVPVETDDRGTEALVGSDPAPPIPVVDDEPDGEPMEGAEDDEIPF